jgi:hypothetical protein
VSRSVVTVQREFRARFRLWLTHEKLGQFPLLTVYVLPV